uniref:Uncharacterized protein n=1 Tax=Oryza sativa subsp. japonica TaxID=39947 RepID=Q653U2_ORYSJ|nr:hypothetical protein [Oryza sativa Japonica Group]BAD45925.1 hypothetical protein [Oryza sativa Japonica Group]
MALLLTRETQSIYQSRPFTVFAGYLAILKGGIISTVDEENDKGLNLFTGGRQREKRGYG